MQYGFYLALCLLGYLSRKASIVLWESEAATWNEYMSHGGPSHMPNWGPQPRPSTHWVTEPSDGPGPTPAAAPGDVEQSRDAQVLLDPAKLLLPGQNEYCHCSKPLSFVAVCYITVDDQNRRWTFALAAWSLLLLFSFSVRTSFFLCVLFWNADRG